MAIDSILIQLYFVFLLKLFKGQLNFSSCGLVDFTELVMLFDCCSKARGMSAVHGVGEGYRITQLSS